MRPIEMIDIDKIHILNPRVRNKRAHREITDNIAAVGLKRPVTLARHSRPESNTDYDLVCGQGRLEAFQALGHHQIPALVVSANEHECLVMSLVENIARRQHSWWEVMQDIDHMHRRGYSDTQIGQKIGVSGAWVNMLVGLLEQGEERLVASVGAGSIPISTAVLIARHDNADTQHLLTELYEGGLRGKAFEKARRLVEARERRGKKSDKAAFGRSDTSRKLTAEQLMRLYQEEVEKERVMIRQADLAHHRLLFVIEAMQVLLKDAEFVRLLGEEGLHTLPRTLAERMSERQAA